MSEFNSSVTIVTPGEKDIPQFRFVGLDGDLCQAEHKAQGVAMAATVRRHNCPVALCGNMTVEAGGPVKAFSEVESDDQGRAVEKKKGWSNGFVLTGAKKKGEHIKIKFI
jgi:hypothetical protein